MKPDNKTITISDIAKEAGVSTATVSRVLNDKNSVAGEVHQRVLLAVKKTGYQPQRVHKSKKALPWIAILAESPINAFFSQVLASIQEQAYERGFFTYIAQMPPQADRCMEILNQVKQQSWAGIISAGYYMEPQSWIRLHEETRIPLVLMNTKAEYSGTASLLVDFGTASTNAIQHLLDLGHKKIAYMGDYGNDISNAQFQGVEAALKQKGCEYPKDYRISVSHTPEGATQGVGRIMMLPPCSRPTAILTYDDEFAIHMLNALRYYNLRVPEDISLIGFDNIPMSAHTLPALTTIDIPKYRIGRHLLDLLQQLLDNNNNEPVGNIIVYGSLVVRASTGRAK
jgi:LacI family transcriptional regulator